MTFLAQRWAGDGGRFKAYVMANPLAQKAILSATLHLVVIVGLLISSMVSCRVRAPRELSPFDLQSIGPAGKVGRAGGGAAASAAVIKPEDGLVIEKRKPSNQKLKIETSQTPVKQPVPAEPTGLTKGEIQKILGSVLKNVGTETAVGSYGAGSGGGTYDPLGWYYSMVRTAMYEAWQQPSTLAGKQGLVTRVMIRVQRNGDITQRSMIQSSGNALMDTSVMTAVESVQRLQELPPGFEGFYKDITIDFELQEMVLGE